MIKNYLLIAFRSLMRQKPYALINITGLAIGLSCSMMIGLYVLNELSYDKFHTKADNIYRVCISGKMGTNVFKGPITCSPLAATLIKDYPEVETAVRLFPNYNQCVNYKEKIFYEDRFLYTDSNFFKIFDFKFIIGDPLTCHLKPNSIIITEPIAKKYFGSENPIGKSFRILNNDSVLLEVTAVIAEMPVNSHFHYDFIASSRSLSYANTDIWVSNNNYTYFILRKGADPKQLEKKFPEMVKRYVGPQIQQYIGASLDDLFKAGNEWGYFLQKLTDIHLYSAFNYELEANGSIIFVWIFSLVSLLILIIACINFTNLAIARSLNRAKEVGLRKVLGSMRNQLITQFLIESILLTFISVSIALILIKTFIPAFNNMLGLKLSFDLIPNSISILVIILFTITIGTLAGSYPAFYLSAFVPAEVLKGKLYKGTRGGWIKNALVVFQFWISIVIILATFTIYSQLRYMQNTKMGFDKDQLIVIERTDPIRKDIALFIDDLRNNPIIENASISNGIPGRIYSNSGFNIEGSPLNETYLLNILVTDENYQKTMGFEMAAGRYYSKEFPSDTLAAVINETAAKYMGLKNPVGTRLITPGPDPSRRQFITIIGVTKDFHIDNLHKPISPLLIGLTEPNFDGYVTVRFSGNNNKEVLKFINKTWQKYSASAPLNYFYFNQEFKNQYRADIYIRRLMSFFSILAIFIACLGLLGLVAYTTARRTKEIGIRKVMGASVINIIQLLSKDTAKLVTLATVVAIPVSVFLMGWWLQEFAYRTKINPLVFVLAALLTLALSIATIFYLALRAARQNPVEALRYE
jgi:putative ABC transport system permease protein